MRHGEIIAESPGRFRRALVQLAGSFQDGNGIAHPVRRADVARRIRDLLTAHHRRPRSVAVLLAEAVWGTGFVLAHVIYGPSRRMFHFRYPTT